MANYALTVYTTDDYDPAVVASNIHDTLEAVDTAKTVRFINIFQTANHKYRGVVIYDT